MARTYTRVFMSIWADEDFTALTAEEQGVYHRLLTGPGLSMCGVTDWRPARLIKSFQGMTRDRLEEIADRLQQSRSRFIVVDHETEEVLIRSFVRYDGVLKSPNLVKAMANDWIEIGSPIIKEQVAWEVRRGFAEEPQAKGLPALPDWFPNPDEPPPNPSRPVPGTFQNSSAEAVPKVVTEPNGNPSGTVSEPIRKGSQGVLVGFPHPSALSPQPEALNPQPFAQPSAAPRTAQDLVGEWIDHRTQAVGTKPTGRVIGQLAKEIKNLLDEDQPYDDVRAGLQLWDTKGLHPATLASCVDEARAPVRPVNRQQQHTRDVLTGALANADMPNPFMTEDERRRAK